MSGFNPPLVFPRAIDQNGAPAPGAKLYATVTETSIPKAIYYDFALTQPCPSPLVADGDGTFPQFFLEGGGYDFTVRDANGDLLRPPENHIFGTGSVSAATLADVIANSDEIVWTEDEGDKLSGHLVWPLVPKAANYVESNASVYKALTGGSGYGTDEIVARRNGTEASRFGVEWGYAGNDAWTGIGDLDGTNIRFQPDAGGAGVDAFGDGAFKFGSLRVGDLAGGGVNPLPIARDNDGDLISRTASEFRGDIGAQESLSTATANHLQLSLTPTSVPTAAGTISWNATDKTADLIQPDGVILQLGQETQVLALNNTGSTIANGAVVRISGASGQRVTIELADADIVGKEDAIGVTTQAITNNQTGKVTIIGLVRDIDTSAFSEGASVYLSTTAGGLVATPPAYPGRIVKVGIVSRSHATQGSLFVHCDYLGGYVTREAAVVNIPGTASSAPSLGNFVDANMQVRRFNGSATQNDLYYSIDVDHDYVSGTDIVFHAHWAPTDTAGGNVRWQIYYQWVESGATWTAATLAGATTAAGTTAWADKRTDFTISGTGHTYNSRLLIHLFRNPSDVLDTYGSDAALIAASAHYISKPDQAG